MAIFTRIVPHTRWTALLLPNFLAGIVFGCAMTLPLSSLYVNTTGEDWPLAGALGILLALLVAWQTLCARVSQKHVAMLRGGVVFVVGAIVPSLIAAQLEAPDGLLLPSRWFLSYRLKLGLLAIGVLFIIVPISALVIGLLMRYVLVRLVPQPEPPAPAKWCWKCGYDLVGLRAGGGGGVCPECGVNLATARPSARRLFDAVDWSWRRRRIIIAVLLAVLMGFEGWLFVTRALPIAKFVRTFETLGPELDTSWFIGPVRTIAYAVPIGNKKDWHICIRYHPQMNGCNEEMCLHLVQTWHEAGKQEEVRLRFGDSTVFMNLDRRQARDVIRNGISKDILAAFEQRGHEVGWRPLQDKTQPKGPWSRHQIDPTPFFPQKPGH